MMAAVQLLITTAGLDALVDAQNGETDAIQVIEVGLTATAFTMAPTITALPGELKRLDAISGQAVSDTIIHMTAQDASTDVYDLRGIGLYLADGTLFAVYAQPTPLFRKVSIASFLLALDIAFANGVAGDIVFGDATFLIPPATETIKGVAEIATTAEVDEGMDDQRFLTPLKLKQRLTSFATAIGIDISALQNAIDALLGRTITGTGLVSGGGSLAADRTLTVQSASVDDIANGSAWDRAITPAALSGLPRSLAANGHCEMPGTGRLRIMWGSVALPGHSSSGSISVMLPDSFYTDHFQTFVSLQGSPNEGDEDDENIFANPSGLGAFQLGWSANHVGLNVAFWAIGR